MKHATDAALDGLEPLLAKLRRVDGISERKRGIFYRKSQAFIHFHEDPAGMFADVRLTPGWLRLSVDTPKEHRALIDVVATELAPANPRKSH